MLEVAPGMLLPKEIAPPSPGAKPEPPAVFLWNVEPETVSVDPPTSSMAPPGETTLDPAGSVTLLLSNVLLVTVRFSPVPPSPAYSMAPPFPLVTELFLKMQFVTAIDWL